MRLFSSYCVRSFVVSPRTCQSCIMGMPNVKTTMVTERKIIRSLFCKKKELQQLAMVLTTNNLPNVDDVACFGLSYHDNFCAGLFDSCFSLTLLPMRILRLQWGTQKAKFRITLIIICTIVLALSIAEANTCI